MGAPWRGGHRGALRGTPTEQARNPRGTPTEQARNPCGTPAEQAQNPRRTGAERAHAHKAHECAPTCAAVLGVTPSIVQDLARAR